MTSPFTVTLRTRASPLTLKSRLTSTCVPSATACITRQSLTGTTFATLGRRAIEKRSRQSSPESTTTIRTFKPDSSLLQNLKDPLKLANHVAALLQNGQGIQALDLVRAASKDRNCTVSWNHIINKNLQEGSVQQAFHMFSEMRKRAQSPDSYTYSLLLRGLTKNVSKTPTAVERALVIVNILQSPRSHVRLSTLHVNAAIEVCAKARNLDAIYGIAAKLPEKGPGAPDNRTFTLILECLRATAMRPVGQSQSYSELEVKGIRIESILQGKRLWSDVLARWRRGLLTMDEMLMQAMGRLLLLGDVRNYDEVLSLVAQTTTLPREIPLLGHPERQTHLKHDTDSIKAPTAPNEDLEASPTKVSAAQIAPDAEQFASDPTSRDLFALMPASKRLVTYANPRNRTLSLLMEACGRMNAYTASQRYWDKITANVAPDLHNFHEYLRILRQYHNSRLAAELVRQISLPLDQDGYGLDPTPLTFRLAMGTCMRDGNNPNCLKHARSILETQAAHSKSPDALSCIILVDLLRRRCGQWPLDEFCPTMDLLDGLWLNLKHFYAYGSGEAPQRERDNFSAFREAPEPVRSQIRNLTLSYYKLIENSMSVYRERLDADTFRIWNKRLYRNRNKLNRMRRAHREHWFLNELDARKDSSVDKVEDSSSMPLIE